MMTMKMTALFNAHLVGTYLRVHPV